MGISDSGPGGASGHDRGYKLLFSDPTLVEELLRGFLPGAWIDQLDFATLEKMGASFVSADLRERHSDLIWRVRLRGEEIGWVYVYLLLEFQSTVDSFMAVRLLTYAGLLLEEIIRKEKLKPEDRLPAVLPLVLYNGERPWSAPQRLESLFVPIPEELKLYLPRLTYHLVDERRLDLNRPELRENLTAALFRVETAPEARTVPTLSQDLDARLPPGDSPLRRTVFTWFISVVRRRFPDAIIPEEITREEQPMLEQALDESFEIARQEGRQEGQLQGRREVLLQLMTLRFGRLPKGVRSRIERITSTRELEELARRVVTAKSLKEMGCESDQRGRSAGP
jgi:predicted transposase YdaD